MNCAKSRTADRYPPAALHPLPLPGCGAGLMTRLNSFVTLPTGFSALTVKMNVPAVVGVPDMIPSSLKYKPSGRTPLSIVHTIGIAPLAVSIELYAVFTAPPGSAFVLIAGREDIVNNAALDVSLPWLLLATTRN